MSEQSTAAKLMDSAKNSSSPSETLMYVGAAAVIGVGAFLIGAAIKPSPQTIHVHEGAYINMGTNTTVNTKASLWK